MESVQDRARRARERAARLIARADAVVERGRRLRLEGYALCQ